jgi:hypothetical protein
MTTSYALTHFSRFQVALLRLITSRLVVMVIWAFTPAIQKQFPSFIIPAIGEGI